jgi:hypothetical protein
MSNQIPSNGIYTPNSTVGSIRTRILNDLALPNLYVRVRIHACRTESISDDETDIETDIETGIETNIKNT